MVAKNTEVKINLERNFNPSRVQFWCAVCEEYCRPDAIRPLLCHDDGAIVGDICTDCLKQPLELTQTRLRQRAAKLISRPWTARTDRTLSPREFAAELNEISDQTLARPPVYVWWWQRLNIAIAETCELEAARRGKNCLRRSKPLKITFLKEEPSIENER